MAGKGNTLQRLVRRLLAAVLAVVLLAAVIVFGISSYAAYSMTRFEREPLDQNPADLGLNYREISFPSRDGLILRGWWIEGEYPDRAIIMVHGSEKHRADPDIKMLEIAGHLVQEGFNVLAFDMRGHGESEGNHVSGGYFEKFDVLGAVDYARDQGMSGIGILGYSMGAAATLLAAAEISDIDAIIADSSYADVEELIEDQFAKRSNLPPFFIPLILYMNKVMYGIDFTAVKPVEAVKQITCPILFIVGGQDDTVTVEQNQRLLEASKNPQSQLWVVPEAEHVQSYVVRPQEYTNRMVAFFNAAIQP